MDSSFLKDASEGASATEAGREFHNGIVCGKKLNLNGSVDVEYCLNFLEWASPESKDSGSLAERSLAHINRRAKTKNVM